MAIARTNERTPQKPPRLWPGVVAVVLQWLVRFGLKIVVPGFSGFLLSVVGGLLGALAIVLWWAFFSRAPRAERWRAIGLMVVALSATFLANHESMGPLWLIAYAIPFLSLAFVAWAVASRHFSDGTRRATMVGTILVACAVWTTVRTTGINGNHVAGFAWRWTESPEEQLLAHAADQPAPLPQADAAATSPAQRLGTRAGDEPSARPAAPLSTKKEAGWPGFRGPGRDGIIRGVRIATDWTRSPPVELWRRPIGPGWSSFAVGGGLLYTQEQRGDEEVVASYDITTGRPVWTHRDRVRFFESNGGAGPRATPTLTEGRVYAFGATGILNALDARDGTVVWSRNVASDTSVEVPVWGFSSSPLAVGDVVIVAAAGQLVAYDRTRGDLRWRGPAGGGGYSSPHLLTIDGVMQVVLQSELGTTSVAPATGTLLWEHRWPGVPIVQPALTKDGDVLITASSGSGTRRIAVAHEPGGWTVKEHWTSVGLKPYFNDFVIHEGYAFGFDGSILACIDLEDGKRKWKGGRYGNGQLVLLQDQGVLLVLSEEGELALVVATPDQFTELARFPVLEGKTWNHPVLVGDVLVVRNGQAMVALRLSPAGQ